MTTVVLVMAGSAVGALSRFLVARYVQSRTRSGFPWGTLAVNVSGCLVLGALLAAAAAGRVPPTVLALVGTGLCGGYTTFSAFGYETVRLAQDGPAGRGRAAGNVALSVGAGLAAAAVGWAVVSAFV